MLVPSSRPGDMAFNAIIAIQSSAFMMTLFKKRIVRGRTHMLVYSGCLVLSAFHFVRVLGLAQTALIAAAFLLRISVPAPLNNKYLLWLGYCVATFYLRAAAPALMSPASALAPLAWLAAAGGPAA